MITDATMTFILNKDTTNPLFSEDEPLFSIPYSKIMKAQEFCKNEDLEYCYVGYRNYDWHIKGIPDRLDPVIKITEEGLHPETNNKYISCITKAE